MVRQDEDNFKINIGYGKFPNVKDIIINLFFQLKRLIGLKIPFVKHHSQHHSVHMENFNGVVSASGKCGKKVFKGASFM